MKFLFSEVDVVVIGVGHAGIEAGVASSRLGKKTIMFALSLDRVASMPCNPSIGGTAKGHLVRELSALGGQIGKAADENTIQTKMLNIKRGPAVRSLRVQIDRLSYSIYMKKLLEEEKNLLLVQDEVVDLDVSSGKIVGVSTKLGLYVKTKAVVIACGTFLKSKIFVGKTSAVSGPDSMPSCFGLSDSLEKLGIKLRRFKTGTPARVNRNSIDFSKLTVQKGDEKIHRFSFSNKYNIENKVDCYIAYTNKKTHSIILDNIYRSPLYSGDIKGIGPRYCPSIEDKVVRFKDKDRHQVFVEPIGLKTNEMYLGGLSSSLPFDVQVNFLRSIKGFENIEIMRPAYAIEYDCCDPTDLKYSLEFKKIEGLYGAGQFNGTSGYEEAAALGFVAGVNAARKIDGQDEFILTRDSSYIGTLIDDIVTKGCAEPYRIMTARSEYRLILRHDNADRRLCEIGRSIKTLSDEDYYNFYEKNKFLKETEEELKKLFIFPTKKFNEELEKLNTNKIDSSKRFSELIKRPQITFKFLERYINEEDKEKIKNLTFEDKEEIEINFKYEEFIEKQKQKILKFKELENKKLPKNIDYERIEGLRTEAKEKLNKIKPESFGQALRIYGVNPADIVVLEFWLRNKRL